MAEIKDRGVTVSIDSKSDKTFIQPFSRYNLLALRKAGAGGAL